MINGKSGISDFVWNGASASFFLYNYVKNINMQITTILAFITAMGGLEAVKWLVRYITCRKTDARKEEASVNSMEEENRRKKGGLVGRTADST